MNIIQIWKNKGQIIEGITNSIFKKEDVEEIAKTRMNTCKLCPLYSDTHKPGPCTILGTNPCCNKEKGGCGCSLKWKTRALSSDCPKGIWKAVLTEEEEDLLTTKLGL